MAQVKVMRRHLYGARERTLNNFIKVLRRTTGERRKAATEELKTWLDKLLEDEFYRGVHHKPEMRLETKTGFSPDVLKRLQTPLNRELVMGGEGMAQGPRADSMVTPAVQKAMKRFQRKLDDIRMGED